MVAALYKAKITRTFPTLGDAKAWRGEATSAVDRGRLARSTRKTVREAAIELIDGINDGSIRSSRRRPYRPSTIRSYEAVHRGLDLVLGACLLARLYPSSTGGPGQPS